MVVTTLGHGTERPDEVVQTRGTVIVAGGVHRRSFTLFTTGKMGVKNVGADENPPVTGYSAPVDR